MKNNSQLPKGWEIKKLGEVCEVYQPKTISKKDMIANGEFPVFGANGVIGQYDKYNHEDTQLLVTCRGATCGSVNISLPKSWINGNAMVIKPKNCSLKRDFLEYFFRGGSDISNVITGAAQPQITRQNLSPVQIPIPPLPEQQRIVKILDKAFVAIDKVKQNAEQNLNNAKELFQSKLQRIFDNGEWEKTTLASIAVYIADGDHMPPPKTETGIPFITISNINKQENRIDFSKTFMVSTEYFQKIHEKRKPQKNDVLYTVTGSYGIPVLIVSDFKFCFQRHIGLIRPNKDTDSKWLFYWVLSPQAIKQAHETATGTAQKTVSLKALRSFSIPKTPLNEQKQIVKQLDNFSSETKKLESTYQQKLDSLAELKKSILQKAFRGEL